MADFELAFVQAPAKVWAERRGDSDRPRDMPWALPQVGNSPGNAIAATDRVPAGELRPPGRGRILRCGARGG